MSGHDDAPYTEWLATLMESRCTVHDYGPEAVSSALLERALELGTSAPNHRLTEPWRFVLAGPAARQRLAEISLDLKRRKAPLTPRAEQEIRDKVLNPPELVVLCRVRHDKPDVEREDYAAIACAVQNIMLWLWAHGLGSKWSTGAVTTAPETYAALGVPAEQEIVGFLWVGRASSAPTKPRRKRPLDQLLRRVP